MATACRVTPRVKTPQGTFEPSNLHQDLMDMFDDAKIVNATWAATRKLNLSARQDMMKDANGEVTVESLIGKTDVGTTITDERIAEGLNRIHSQDNPKVGVEGMMSVARDCVRFDQRGELEGRVTAEVKVTDEGSRMEYVPYPQDAEGQTRLRERKSNETLDEVLRNKLGEWGIEVGALTEAEEASGIEGMIDFTASRRAAEGAAAMIRLAKGEVGQAALTEEFAHLAVAGLADKDADIKRTLTALEKNDDLVKEILGDKYEAYNEAYKGNKTKLIHEAAGQILRDALKREHEIMNRPQASRFSNLWNRFVTAIKNFFKNLSASELDKAIMEARGNMMHVADKILSDECYKELDFSDLAEGLEKLFAIGNINDDTPAKKQARLKDIVERMIRDNKARMRMIPAFLNIKKKGKLRRYDYLKILDTNMKGLYENGEYYSAMYQYILNAARDLHYRWQTFDEKYQKATIIGKLSIIKNINDMIDVYTNVLADVSQEVEILREEATTTGNQDMLDVVADFDKILNGGETTFITHVVNGTKVTTQMQMPGLSALIQNCRNKIGTHSMSAFLQFAQKFVPINNIIVPNGGEAYGKKGGEEVTLEDQLQRNPEEGLLSKYLLSAALSNNMLVQTFQRILNQVQLEVREDMLTYQKRLQELVLKLEKSGVRNQDWMFARDKNGKLTGKYIDENSVEYSRLSKAQKEFYQNVIDIKRELDSMLPYEVRELLNAPKIRKDFLEQIERTDKSAFKAISEYLKGEFSVTSDDEYMLQNDKLLISYNNQKLRMVPIRFLKFAEDEDSQNMSLDIVATLGRYAQMCCNYSKMTRVMMALEVGRGLAKQGFTTKEVVKVNDKGERVRVYEDKEQRGINPKDRTMSRIDDIMEMGYGFNSVNATATIMGKNISISKIGQNLMALTAANQYMMSVNAAVQNGITAQLQIVGSIIGHKYFNLNDITWAQSMCASHLPTLFSDVFKRVPNSKVSLFVEKFNVMMKDHHERFNRTGAKRFAKSETLYAGTTMTEFHANMAISLAVAHRTKLKDKNGHEINLWDAMEVVDMATKYKREALRLRALGEDIKAQKIEDNISKHPEWKNSENKFMVVKEGVTTLDGQVVDDDYIHNITRRMMHVSHVFNGVYNSEDRAHWQRYIGGQMLGMYRKWIAPAWHRRLNGLNFSLDDQEWDEGFYRTAARVSYLRVKALFDKTTAAQIKGTKLQDWELRNLKTAAFEIGMWVVALGLKALMSGYKKKNRKSFLWNTLYYYVVRTSSELSSMNPVGMVNESVKILQSPSAVLSTINSTFGLIGCLFNPYTWGVGRDKEAFVQTGRYKGLSKLERAFVKSPFLPFSSQYMAFRHPEDAVRFYE